MGCRDNFTLAVAAIVHTLFANGRVDVSAEVIAKYYYPDKIVGGETIDGFRKRMLKIGKILLTDYGHDTDPVNDYYCRRYLGGWPIKSDEEGFKCLPGGNGVSTAGLRLYTGGNENENRIRRVTQMQRSARMLGEQTTIVNRDTDAIVRKQDSVENINSRWLKTRQQFEPKNRSLAREIMRELEAPKKDVESDTHTADDKEDVA